MLGDAPRSGRPVEVDSDRSETLIENNQCDIYHMGDSQHTQHIQMSEVTGENEKRVFHFMERNIRTFSPTQYSATSHTLCPVLCVL